MADAAATVSAVSTSCNWTDVACNVTSFGGWLYNVVMYVPQKLWSLLLDGLGAVIEWIPAPDFVTSAASALSGLTGATGVGYWLDLFQVPAGFAMFMSALLARFILRRIPMIGG